MHSLPTRAVAPLAGAGIGAAFFLWIAGLRIVDPTQIGWVLQLDWRIHFLGWHLFRGRPWGWPPGRLDAYYAPIGTAIGYTDSIPLAAFLLKPFSSVLPMPFQYLGAWLLLCYALQGLFGVILVRVWCRSVLHQCLGATALVLMPTLLMRVGHPALCSHWLLLWALWLYFRADRAPAMPPLWSYAALGLTAGLVHPYLAVMALAIVAADALHRRRLRLLACVAGGTLGGWWASGLFTVSGADSLAGEGLVSYSLNLLAPVTPTGWSTLLPDLPAATPWQTYEGFQYFGAGLLLLLIVAFLAGCFALRSLPWRTVWPLAGVTVACAVFSLSPRVTFGAGTLVDFWSPTMERFAVFRAAGRFFWPLAYLLVVTAVAVVVTRMRVHVATLLLALAIVLQMIDLRDAHAARRQTARDPAFHAWTPPLRSAAWPTLLPHYQRLVLYPPPQCGSSPVAFEAAAYAAGLYGMSVNAGEIARPDPAARDAYCRNLRSEIDAGDRLDDAVYLVHPSQLETFRSRARRPITCVTLDALPVCTTIASANRWHDALPSQ